MTQRQKEIEIAAVDTVELESKIKDMYRHAANDPHEDYHFELGRPLTERLGYTADVLDGVGRPGRDQGRPRGTSPEKTLPGGHRIARPLGVLMTTGGVCARRNGGYVVGGKERRTNKSCIESPE